MSAQARTAVRRTTGSLLVKRRTGDPFGASPASITRKAFELFEASGRWFGNDLANWFRAEAEIRRTVPLKLAKSDGHFTLQAAVPGSTAKAFEIQVEPHCVSIAGRRKLPAHFNAAKFKATLKDGVLTIELPLARHAGPRAKASRVEPKTAGIAARRARATAIVAG